MPDDLGLPRKQITSMAHEGLNEGKTEAEIVDEITLYFSRYYRPGQLPLIRQKIEEIVVDVRDKKSRFEKRWKIRESRIKNYRLPKDEEKDLLAADKYELMVRYLGEEEAAQRKAGEEGEKKRRKSREEKSKATAEKIRRAKLPETERFAEDLVSGKMFKINALPILLLFIAAVASFYILQSAIVFTGFLAWAFYFLIPDVDPKYRNLAWAILGVKALFKVGVIFIFSFVLSFSDLPFIPAQVPMSLAIAIFGYFLLHKSEVDLLQPGQVLESIASFILVGLTVILLIYNFYGAGWYSFLLSFVYLAFFLVLPSVKQLDADDKDKLDATDAFTKAIFRLSESKFKPIDLDYITIINRGLFALFFTLAFISILFLLGTTSFIVTTIIFIAVLILCGISGFMWATRSAQAFWIVFGLIFLMLFGLVFMGLYSPSLIIGGLAWIFLLFIGITSPDETRPYLGVFAFILAFFIFTFTVGGDIVGNAFFGELWPEVQDFLKTTLTPLKEAFSDAYKSFTQIFNLLTNPVAYARGVVEGIYQNPTTGGKVGAFGIEISDLSLEKMGLLRPFIITVLLTNVGAADAKDVELNLDIANVSTKIIEAKQTDTTLFGLSPMPPIKTEVLEQDSPKDFTFRGEVTCDWIRDLKNGIEYDGKEIKYDFGKNYIVPVKAVVSYDYNIDSKLDIEVIDKSERERMVRAKTLKLAQKKSEMTTSPAALSISMEKGQPIGEGEPFFIDFELKPKEEGGSIDSAEVEINFPVEFFDPKSTGGTIPCKSRSGEPKPSPTGSWVWTFENVPEDGVTVSCGFEKGISIDRAQKTFLVSAHSSFRFTKIRERSVKFEFGNVCCKDIKESCLADSVCPADGAECVKKEGGGVTFVTVAPEFDPDYCTNKISKNTFTGEVEKACEIGEGNCRADNECSTKTKYFYETGQLASDLLCRLVVGWGEEGSELGVCCPEGATTEQCKAAYLEFLSQKKSGTTDVFDYQKIQEVLLAAK